MLQNKETPAPRGLQIETPANEEKGDLGIMFIIDKDTRDLKSFNVYGLETFPCSASEIVGWLEIVKNKIISHSFE